MLHIHQEEACLTENLINDNFDQEEGHGAV
jgi:hypothetical protein